MSICIHERLNEEGICRTCGNDCRGIHQEEIKVGDQLDGPSCHVCGAIMVKEVKLKLPEGRPTGSYFVCLSCGATAEAS